MTTLSVMVVDDEAPARQRLRDLLADVAAEVPNVVVAEAANGLLAVAAIEGLAVDVALVDIRMPKMDGIELARHLAQLEHPPVIIFVTAYDAYAVQAFELNCHRLPRQAGARTAAGSCLAQGSAKPAACVFEVGLGGRVSPTAVSAATDPVHGTRGACGRPAGFSPERCAATLRHAPPAGRTCSTNR